MIVSKNISAVFMRDGDGLTPLLRAAKFARFRVVISILTSYPQSAYLRDPNGWTFMHLLRFAGGDIAEFSAEFIFKLMGKHLFEIPEADAQRLVRDHDGNIPLHYAIMTQNFVTAKALTQRHLELEDPSELLYLANKKGETVTYLLATHDTPNEIIEMFEKKCGVMYNAKSSYGIRKREIRDSASSLSVIAALLATITFAAAFQVPGGFDGENGSPVLLKKEAFQVFLVSDAFAMCGSMVVLFSLLWVMGCGKAYDSFILLDFSMSLLQASFYATLLTFMTGVYVATAEKTLWLAIFVCALCSIVILFTWRTLILSLIKFIRLVIDVFNTVKGLSFKKYKKLILLFLGIHNNSSL